MKTNVTCIVCNTQFSVKKIKTDSPVCDQCNLIINRVIKRKEFVQKCGELLSFAKPHLIKCEYMLGQDVNDNQYEKLRIHDEDEYVVVTCESGYTYNINITANSLIATAKAIFEAMAYK